MRATLKQAIVSSGLKYLAIANKANERLDGEAHLSEGDISRLVYRRKDPTPAQASALAKILGKPARALFE